MFISRLYEEHPRCIIVNAIILKRGLSFIRQVLYKRKYFFKRENLSFKIIELKKKIKCRLVLKCLYNVLYDPLRSGRGTTLYSAYSQYIFVYLFVFWGGSFLILFVFFFNFLLFFLQYTVNILLGLCFLIRK